MEIKNKICSRCVLDSTVPEIIFDNNGECNYCMIHDQLEQIYPKGDRGQKILDSICAKIKKRGKGKKYDCIVGVSGGTDSTYMLYFTKTVLGLNPLAVHFDNGWNSDIAVRNIKNATNKLKIDLHTIVANWEEFKKLQIAFLKSSTPDAEVPTDYAIISVLMKVAAKEGVKYMIEGQSFRAEGTTPVGWTYHDGKYLNAVNSLYGNKKPKSFPLLTMTELLYFSFIRGIKPIRPFEYIDYSKEKAKKIIIEELGWVDPGGHHHESIFTKFFQSYYLVKKFDIDKRKRELSAKIRSGQISRIESLKILEKPYEIEDGIVEYTYNKLGLSTADFKDIMGQKPKSFLDYPNQYSLIQKLRYPIKIACDLNIFPPIFYLKYGINHAQNIKAYWKKFNKISNE